jgi:hypothetical protein
MSFNVQQVRNAVLGELRRARGHHPALEGFISKAEEPEALRQLLAVLRDMRNRAEQAERKAKQPWLW